MQLVVASVGAPTAAASSRPSHARIALQTPCWRRQQLHRINARRCVASQAATEQAAATATTDAPAAPVAAVASSSSQAAALTYTSYEGNSFRLQFAKTGVNVLVDPWLVGKLTFGGLDFVYAGTKRVARPESIDLDRLAAETDFILLSQGIDDHAHRPTLQRLSKVIPVVASPAGAAVARSLGFRTIHTLRPGQSVTLAGGRITVQGTEGALVGPPWSQRELGVVIRENVSGGTSLYYEPHADYLPDSVSRVAPVDVVVSPPCSQILLGYPLVKGSTDSVDLLRLLRPKAYIPLMNAEFDQSGPLADLLVEEGGPDQIAAQLAAQPDLKGIVVQVPKAAQPMGVQL